jgi:hypothetical protein
MQNVSPQDNSIEANVFELDILGELLHERILRGRVSFLTVLFFVEKPV